MLVGVADGNTEWKTFPFFLILPVFLKRQIKLAEFRNMGQVFPNTSPLLSVVLLRVELWNHGANAPNQKVG